MPGGNGRACGPGRVVLLPWALFLSSVNWRLGTRGKENEYFTENLLLPMSPSFIFSKSNEPHRMSVRVSRIKKEAEGHAY